MAMDVARKLYMELQEDKARYMEFTKDPAAFLAAGGYDCTEAEMRECTVMNRELDDDELDAVSGGKADGPGGCNYNFYTRKCQATVEEGSWCWSNDWCYWDDKTYGSTVKRYRNCRTTADYNDTCSSVDYCTLYSYIYYDSALYEKGT